MHCGLRDKAAKRRGHMTQAITQSCEFDGTRAPGGTGPRTPAGKRRTRHDAIRHGIFAALLLTAEPFRESTHDYERFLEHLCKAVKPRNELDQTLVEVLAIEFLRLSRIYKADAQIASRLFEQIHTGLVQDDARIFTESVDKGTEIAFIQKPLDPDLLLRYATTVTKHIHRILDRLDRK